MCAAHPLKPRRCYGSHMRLALPSGTLTIIHYQPATELPNLRPQKVETGLRSQEDPSPDIPWKVWLQLCWLLKAANLKWKPLENMFSYKIYKGLCCRANSWKWRASSHSPWSDFLQHFGTSGSAPGRHPEAREVIKHGLLPGQLWARLLLREGWLMPGERLNLVYLLLFVEGTQGTYPEQCHHSAFPRCQVPGWRGQPLSFCITLALTKYRSTSDCREGHCK